MTGYFAFPPVPDPKPPAVPSVSYLRASFAFTQNLPTGSTTLDETSQSPEVRAPDSDREAAKEQAWAHRCRRDAELHEARLQRERAEAWQGELAWVRSGGIIRDARGRRDMARTEHLRAEIRLLDEEQRIMDRWNAYETRWRVLTLSTAVSDANVKWEDIPWPTQTTPQSMDDFTPESVEEFVFAPLKLRGNTTSRKERIRSSILRWHPDKVAAILSHVVEEQQQLVREGVNAIFRILWTLQDADKGVQP